MTQNTIWSLFGAAVIAVGFLLGWCAGAFELAPARAPRVSAAGAGERVISGILDLGASARVPSASVRERTDHPAFIR